MKTKKIYYIYDAHTALCAIIVCDECESAYFATRIGHCET